VQLAVDDLRLTLHDKFIHLDAADPGPASHPYAAHWFDVWRDNAAWHLDYRPGPVDFRVAPYADVGVHEPYDRFVVLEDGRVVADERDVGAAVRRWAAPEPPDAAT
jgi:hypothetical protein